MAGYVAATLVALTIGFVIGMTLFKRSNRWCPHCGHTLTCTGCSYRPALALDAGQPTTARDPGRRT